MKIKFTFSDMSKGYLAGLVYEVPDKQAREYLDADKAIEVLDADETKQSDVIDWISEKPKLNKAKVKDDSVR